MSIFTGKIVAYLIAPLNGHKKSLTFSQKDVAVQEVAVQDFLAQSPHCTLSQTFVEFGNTHCRRINWPELKKAVDYCQQEKALLVIAQIGNLTGNRSFNIQLFRLMNPKQKNKPMGNFYCCDEPYINRDNYEAIVAHTLKKQAFHQESIKRGLSLSKNQGGNPEARKLIQKINKSRIDSALSYALFLHPVVRHFQSLGLSQRKMIRALNTQNFFAPEGGKWCLSQYQKVLERINLTDSALKLETLLANDMAGFPQEEIASKLNEQAILTLKGENWTTKLVFDLQKRIKQLHELILISAFTCQLIPLLEQYHFDDLTENEFLKVLSPDQLIEPTEVTLNHEKISTMLEEFSQKGDLLEDILNRMKNIIQTSVSLNHLFLENPYYAQYLTHLREKGRLPSILDTLIAQNLKIKESEHFLEHSLKTKHQRRLGR